MQNKISAIHNLSIVLSSFLSSPILGIISCIGVSIIYLIEYFEENNDLTEIPNDYNILALENNDIKVDVFGDNT